MDTNRQIQITTLKSQISLIRDDIEHLKFRLSKSTSADISREQNSLDKANQNLIEMTDALQALEAQQ